VKKELIKRGYALELQTYQQLVEKSWEVELNSSYWNVETNPAVKPCVELEKDILSFDHGKVIRTIDLIAEKEIRYNSELLISSKIILVIECKHRTNDNWAFHYHPYRLDQELIERWDKEGGTPGTRGAISLFESAMMDEMYSGRKPFSTDEIPMFVRKQLNWVSHQSIANLDKFADTGVTLFSKNDSLHASVQQLLDAAVFRSAWEEHFVFGLRASKRETSRLKHYWRIYPVIIFDGPIWSFGLAKNDLVVKSESWITYSARRKDYEFYIDIVTLNSLDTYLKHLEEELTRLEKIRIQKDCL
jgi:hypothetical protein